MERPRPEDVFHACVGTIDKMDIDETFSGDEMRFDSAQPLSAVELRKGPKAGTEAARYYRPNIGGVFYIVGAKVRNNAGKEDSLSHEDLQEELADFREHGVSLWEHQRGIGPVGTVTAAYVDDRNRLMGRIKLFAECGWSDAPLLRKSIEEGVTRSFSISWSRNPDTKKARLNEITCCATPKVTGANMEGLVEAAASEDVSMDELRRIRNKREFLSSRNAEKRRWGVGLKLESALQFTADRKWTSGSVLSTALDESLYSASKQTSARASALNTALAGALSGASVARAATTYRMASAVVSPPTAPTEPTEKLKSVLDENNELRKQLAVFAEERRVEAERKAQQDAIEAQQLEKKVTNMTADFTEVHAPLLKDYVRDIGEDRITVEEPAVLTQVNAGSTDPAVVAQLIAANKEARLAAAATMCGNEIVNNIVRNPNLWIVADYCTWLGKGVKRRHEQLEQLNAKEEGHREMTEMLRSYGGKRPAEDERRGTYEAGVAPMVTSRYDPTMMSSEPAQKKARMMAPSSSSNAYGVQPAHAYGGHSFGRSAVAAYLETSTTDYRGAMPKPPQGTEHLKWGVQENVILNDRRMS